MLHEEKMIGAPGKMKQFASWFTHGVTHGAQLRKSIYESHNEVEILSAVDRFFEALLAGKLTAAARPVAASAAEPVAL
jgi:hypothetical protein